MGDHSNTYCFALTKQCINLYQLTSHFVFTLAHFHNPIGNYITYKRFVRLDILNDFQIHQLI